MYRVYTVQASGFVGLGFVLFNLVLLRKLEYHERLDFALKRRLKAENIHVNLEMEAFNLFSTAVASATAVGGSSRNIDGNGMALESGMVAASTLAAFRVKDQDLRLRDQVGAGALCDVFLGKWRATEVAVKKLRGSEGAGSGPALIELRHFESARLCAC